MVFAAYEFVQKRAERKGEKAERERIEREMEALVSNGDGSVTISPEDIRRITRPNRE